MVPVSKHDDFLLEIIPHLFFPRNFPQCKEKDLIGLEYKILHTIHGAVVLLCQNGLGPNIPKTRKLISTWVELQLSLEQEEDLKVLDCLKNMQPGDFVPMYIRNQNAGLFISTPTNDPGKIIISSCQASCSSSSIMSSEKDLLVQVPEQSLITPRSNLFLSEAFSNLLITLTTTELSMALPKSKKAGQEYDESRDVADPMFITEWVTSLLAITGSRSSTEQEFPRIIKKVRDDVIYKAGKNYPWRRSGLWMTAKAALQLSLTLELGEYEGTFFYKLLLLKILLRTFKATEVPAEDVSLWDLRMQMMAKMAKRMEKLKLRYPEDSLKESMNQLAINQAISGTKISKSIRMSQKYVFLKIEETMKASRAAMENMWNTISLHKSPVEEIALTPQQLSDDTRHTKLQELLDYINKRTAELPVNSQLHSDISHPRILPRIQSDCTSTMVRTYLKNIEKTTIRQHSFHEIGFALYEVERWIQTQLSSDSNPTCIRDLAIEYSSLATKHYKDDPLAYSQMILSILQCIKVLDEIAVNKYPLLKEYPCGLNINVFESLLIPTARGMKLAYEIESYYRHRDSQARIQSTLINKDEPNSQSFEVRFAKQDHHMQMYKEAIMQKMDAEIQKKKDEVESTRIEIIKQREICASFDECPYTRSPKKKKGHKNNCAKCIARQTLTLETSVKPYERIFPMDEVQQNAILFDLMVPPSLASLRDLLHFFRVELCSENSVDKNILVWKEWKDYKPLELPNLPQSQAGRILFLASTQKLGIESHYAGVQNRLKVSRDSPDSFIFANGMNTRYHNKIGILTHKPRPFKTSCVFEIHKVQSKFKGLQWAVNDSTHSTNKAIAEQSNCPTGLTVPEFIQFGSLRAGNRLQYRNILLALSNGTLPLKYEPVFQLLSQAQWELGLQDVGDWHRDSHTDYNNEYFSSEFLNLLNELVEKVKENWSEPYALLSLITITYRISELTPHQGVRNQALSLLKKCRQIGFNWMQIIQQIRTNMFKESENRTQCSLNLIDAALVCCMTYPSGFQPDGKTEDLFIWLNAISCLHEEVIQDELFTSLSPTRKSLLRNVLTEVSTRLELQVCSGESPEELSIQSALSRFLSLRCNDYIDTSQWKQILNSGQATSGFFKCQASSKLQPITDHTVVVDLRFGKFLIDGFPVGKLPDSITSHVLYQRVFSKSKFAVQKNRLNTFNTTGDANIKYSFRFVGSMLIIQEINHQDKTVLELLPPAVFQDNLPYNLKLKKSHWWNISTNIIHLRPLQFKDEKFHTEFQYNFSLENMRLTDSNSHKYLVARTSNSFVLLTSPLKTIEPLEYFNIWVAPYATDAKEVIDSLEINLIRLGLQFNVENGKLVSHEYPDSFVSPDQNIGTLVGLQNILVLKEKSISPHVQPTRKLIIPHGTLNIHASSLKLHQEVSIDSEVLRNPRYVVYELDDRMKMLKAERNQSSWIYLAALHASTSSSLPDPFTAFTGTEMAFEILQSAKCWSCHPYDIESLQTLEAIEDLSPKRNYYPSHIKTMQQTSWPIGIPSTSAHEGFALIVKKLKKDSLELSPLFATTKETTQNSNSCATPKNPDDTLAIKHYRRQASLSSHSATIKRSFDKEVITRIATPISNLYARKCLIQDLTRTTEKIRIMSELFQKKQVNFDFHVPHYLLQWLISSHPINCIKLKYPTVDNFKDFKLPYWVDVKHWAIKDSAFRHQWLSLYNLAKNYVKHGNTRSEWQILLSGLLMTGEVDMKEVLLLQSISMIPGEFPQLSFDIQPVFDRPNEEYSSHTINKVFVSNQKLFNSGISYPSSGTIEQIQRLKEEHNITVAIEATKCERHVQVWYRSDSQTTWLSDDLNTSITSINLYRAKDSIDEYLKTWRQNRTLKQFLTNVEESILRVIPKSLPLPSPKSLQSVQQLIRTMTPEVQNGFGCFKNVLISDPVLLQLVTSIFKTGSLEKRVLFEQPITLTSLESALNYIRTGFINKVLSNTEKHLSPSSSNCLRLSGLYPKLVPTVLLHSFLRNSGNGTINLLVGALGVLWTLEQKIIRCMRYLVAGDSMKVALERELQSKDHEGWSTIEHPEWLILELEMDMMIRPMQLATAKEMLSPVGKNSVMQLNCGEGKTSLIVPMVALAVTDQATSLCRITVLRSIFETNYTTLKYTLGGILNRKILTVPCRRDVSIDSEMVETIQNVLEKCVEEKGVLLTVPEHRLSFQLKGYEMSLRDDKKDSQAACELIKAQQWLNSNARDILDESDELLSAKYQLVYTIGESQNIDAGDVRWQVAQSLLKLLPIRMQELHEDEDLGDSHVEFQGSQSSEIFPTSCRLLNKDSYTQLIDKLSDDCLDGLIPEFPRVTTLRPLIKEFLIVEGILAETHQFVLDEFKKRNDRTYDILLLLSGYLKGQVLLKALTKRWRVNYGVDPNGRKRLAVPFRAKDVATERTEFGHADIAIVLTQLSYYYSGLDENQLRECFECISRRRSHRSPEEIYEGWIQNIPQDKLPSSIRSFSGVNLQDFNQWSQHIFPTFRKSMLVIDYWLSSVVFPKECKQYPNKISCTAYDLCPEKAQLTTGFSGTNDSRDLLPLTINQIDLAESVNTNKELEAILTLPENSKYSLIPVGTPSTSLFRPFKSQGIRVLLDCGALILELSNEQVAEEWLKADESIEAVVYFNNNNVLSVKSRTEDKAFELSPFRKRLNVCAVYLDDEHTRGTDLTLPHGYKACVTLGSGLTKDKMVQACMRMRLLGKGHTVSFWASHEANTKIEDSAAKEPALQTSLMVHRVMNWVKQNSREFLEDGLVYWTAGSINYARKVTAEKLLIQKGQYDRPNLNAMAQQCLEKEILDLPSMYGEVRTERRFVDVIPEWFQAAQSNAFGDTTSTHPHELFERIKPLVVERCGKFIENRTQFLCQMDEEHEKEIEKEVEEEKEVARPAAASPKIPQLSEIVKTLIKSGSPETIRKMAKKKHTGISILPQSFKSVDKVWSLIETNVNAWGSQFYATDDFNETISPLYGSQWWNDVQKSKSGDFLRPPTWIVLFGNGSQDQCFLLISPHEANELFHTFRLGGATTTLLMYNPRFLPSQNLLIDNPKLSLPPLGMLHPNQHILAPLFLFSGSLFFASEDEQRAMAECLGICMKYYDKALIVHCGVNGGVNQLSGSSRSELPQCGVSMKFQTIPARLVKEILMTRHQGSTPLNSHIARLVFDEMPSEIQTNRD